MTQQYFPRKVYLITRKTQVIKLGFVPRHKVIQGNPDKIQVFQLDITQDVQVLHEKSCYYTSFDPRGAIDPGIPVNKDKILAITLGPKCASVPGKSRE